MWRQTVPKEPDNGGRGYPVSSLPLPPPPTALSSGVGHPPTTTQMGQYICWQLVLAQRQGEGCVHQTGGQELPVEHCNTMQTICKVVSVALATNEGPAPVVCRAISDITQLVHNVLVSAAAILSSSIRPLLVGGEEKHVSTCIGWVGLTPQCLNRHTHTHMHAHPPSDT